MINNIIVIFQLIWWTTFTQLIHFENKKYYVQIAFVKYNIFACILNIGRYLNKYLNFIVFNNIIFLRNRIYIGRKVNNN